MSNPGTGLQTALQYMVNDRYHRLTTDVIWNAKTDLANILKRVAGAQADNVMSLRVALKAAEEKNWDRLSFVKADAMIDYDTLMMEYRKGHVTTSQTLPARRGSLGFPDLSDLPDGLKMITNATKKLEEQKEAELLREQQQREQLMLLERHEQQQRLQEEQRRLLQEQQRRDQEQQLAMEAQMAERAKLKKEAVAKENMRAQKSQRGPRSSEEEESSVAENLAESFNALFDTEWRLALVELDEAKPDSKDSNIKILADIVEACFQYCKRLAYEQFQDIWEKTVFPIKEVPEWLNVSKDVRTEAAKSVRRYRQDTAMYTIPTIQMTFTRQHLKKMLDPDLHTTCILNYTSKCIELSWLFNIQSPPMCFLWARTGQKVTGHLTVHTKHGDIVWYNVWPALLLHEGGAVLCRGVVQPQ